jgi:hypothetical protein
MKRIEKKVTIEYWWKRDDGKEIQKYLIPLLDEAAETRINFARGEGYTSGELSENLEVGDKCYSFSGWWSTKEEDTTEDAPEMKMEDVKKVLDLIRSNADRQLQLINEVRGEHKRDVIERMNIIKDLCDCTKWQK